MVGLHFVQPDPSPHAWVFLKNKKDLFRFTNTQAQGGERIREEEAKRAGVD